MENEKFKIPVVGLQALNRLKEKLKSTIENHSYGRFCKQVDHKNEGYIKYVYPDSSENFFFLIKDIIVHEKPLNNGKKRRPYPIVKMCPSSESNVELLEKKMDEDVAINKFTEWLNWMSVYKKTTLSFEENEIINFESELRESFNITNLTGGLSSIKLNADQEKNIESSIKDIKDAIKEIGAGEFSDAHPEIMLSLDRLENSVGIVSFEDLYWSLISILYQIKITISPAVDYTGKKAFDFVKKLFETIFIDKIIESIS